VREWVKEKGREEKKKKRGRKVVGVQGKAVT
jgi:hypothetical protein